MASKINMLIDLDDIMHDFKKTQVQSLSVQVVC
jgi:hypothetical protein